MFPCMKAARFLLLCFTLSMLSSCGLINSALKIPASILRTAGRTVGVSNLSDVPAAPVNESQTEEDAEASAE